MNPITRVWRSVTRKLFSQMLSAMELHSIKSVYRDDSPYALMKKFKGWVYRAASMNAQTVASIPLRLYAKGGTRIKDYGPRPVSRKAKAFIEQKQQRSLGEVTEITEHPLLDLLRLANPLMTGHTLTELTVLHQELVGDAYWYLRPASGLLVGLPDEVWPLMPHKVKIVPSKTKLIEGYLFGNPGQEESYRVEEVIHFRYPNPLDSLYGMSPLKAALAAVNRSEAMDQWQQALYDNNCRPDFIVKVPENTDEGEIEKMYERFDSRFKGSRRSGRPWIATGDASIEMLNFSPKDVNALFHAKFDRDTVFTLFGVPVSMIEVTKSRAEAEAGLYQYMRHSILPRTTRMEQELTEKLCPLYDERLFVSFDNPVPEDEAAKVTKVVSLTGAKVMTRNEGREEFGLEKMDGLDEFEDPAPMFPEEEEEQPRPPKDDEEEPGGKVAKGGGASKPFPFDRDEKGLPPLTRVEARFKAKTAAVISAESRFVLDRLEKMTDSGGSLVTKDPAEILAGIETFSDVYASKLEDVLIPLLKAGYRAGVRQVVAHSKGMAKALKVIPAQAWTVANPEVWAWAQAYPRKFGARVNETFARDITKVVAEGVDAAMTGREIQQRLMETVLGVDSKRRRAETIARTESNRAVHGGMVEAWKSSGVVEGKEWLAFPDACEFCQTMNGKTIALDTEYFALGGSLKLDDGREMRFEYEGVNAPPAHPNCRCGLLATFREPSE